MHENVKGKGEFAVLKHWNSRNRADLIQSVTPCHDIQVVGPNGVSNPLPISKSEDYTTGPPHLQTLQCAWRQCTLANLS